MPRANFPNPSGIGLRQWTKMWVILSPPEERARERRLWWPKRRAPDEVQAPMKSWRRDQAIA